MPLLGSSVHLPKTHESPLHKNAMWVHARPSHNRIVFLLSSASLSLSVAQVFCCNAYKNPYLSLSLSLRSLDCCQKLFSSISLYYYFLSPISCPQLLLLWVADLKHNYADVRSA
jgi:hypothetical protein